MRASTSGTLTTIHQRAFRSDFNLAQSLLGRDGLAALAMMLVLTLLLFL